MDYVTCEYCGKTMLRDEAYYYEEGDFYVCPVCLESKFVTCERCGAEIPHEDAYRGFDGYLCECCHDDLFG